jgi:4-hydroxy-2-oxoheptanedioate aldolase
MTGRSPDEIFHHAELPHPDSTMQPVTARLLLNTTRPTVAQQFSHVFYDWILVDCHSPMEAITMSAMLGAVSSGSAMKSMVRVAVYDDPNGIQQALDLGANSILIPHINTAEEAAAGVLCYLYPFGKAGTRSVYFLQRWITKTAGLLGHADSSINDNVIIALQVEDYITDMESICTVPRIAMVFLEQNDLVVSMGLFDGKYEFPAMHTCPELEAAMNKLSKCAKAKDILLGMFRFGTDHVTEFMDKDFNFILFGNDVHYCLAQNFAHKEALVVAATYRFHEWTSWQCSLLFGMSDVSHNQNPGAVDTPSAPITGEFGVEWKAALCTRKPKFGILGPGTTSRQQEAFLVEIKKNMAASAHCVVVPIGSMQLDGHVCLLMELYGQPCQHTSLANSLNAAGGTFLLKHALEYAEHMLTVLASFHKQHLYEAHLDIKPGIVLLDANDRMYLTDFDIASVAGVTLLIATSARDASTPACMVSEQHDPSQYGKSTGKADVRAWGYVMIQMIGGAPPWDGLRPNQILMQVAVHGNAPPLPLGLPYHLMALIADGHEMIPNRDRCGQSHEYS